MRALTARRSNSCCYYSRYF